MARRSNIRRRGKSWVVYFRIRDPERRSVQVQRSFRSLDEAKLYLAQSNVKRERGEFRRPAKITFRDFAAEWLRVYAAVHLKQRTLEAYEGSLRCHMLPHFGERQLTELTRKDIEAFFADWLTGGPSFQQRLRVAREQEQARWRAEFRRVREEEARRARAEGRQPRAIDPSRRQVRLGRSPGTVSNAFTVLHKMLGDAVSWDYLHANPATGVKRPRVPRIEMHFLEAAEVAKLLEKARPEWRTLFLCAVATGMRLGELLAVRWGDVDWNSGRIWVRRNVTRSGRFQEPKTRGSVRAIAMPPTLVHALREHQLASPFSGEDELIFTTTGRPLDGGNLVRREFKPALRRGGLRQIRFHDLRHTFASLLIAQGEHPKYISEQLGHASVAITLDRYAHLLPQSYGHAGDRLEETLFGQRSASSGASDGAAAFRADDESAAPVPLVSAVSRQEAALTGVS